MAVDDTPEKNSKGGTCQNISKKNETAGTPTKKIKSGMTAKISLRKIKWQSSPPKK